LALLSVISAVVLLAGIPLAHAQIGSDRYSSIVVDARSGRELSSVNADEPRHPASLTKMMTLYMVFEAMRDRRLSLDTIVPVSPHSASMSPSKLGLVPGTSLTVEQAILGLVTKSANDAAAALGELLGGDETNFGQMMTIRARSLGMTRTVFRNASGLPDPEQVSTARDMATLGRRLIADFPSEYRYFSTPSFRFHNKVIQNHDHLLQTYPGADGIKTGFITASGFNLVTSAVRSDVRLVGVVMGAGRAIERDLHMAVLLNQGFEQLDIPVPTATAHSDTSCHAPLPPAGAAAPALPPPHAPQSRWAILLGSFSSEATARQAATNARRLTDAGQIRIDSASSQGKQAWRAQIIGLSGAEASGACAALSKRKLVCTPVKSDSGQLARS
jgi:D-alanyl-D-alanine carboxypeptidase